MPIALCELIVLLQSNEEKQQIPSPSAFDIDGFIDYLQSLAGGNKSYNVARAIAADVAVFFQHTSHSSTSTYYDILLDSTNLYNYIKHLQNDKQFTASTVSEKLRRLRQAIEFVEDRENSLKLDQKLLSRCQLITSLLAKWGKSLHKEIAKQRRKQLTISEQQVKVAHNPSEFLESQAINASVKQFITKAESSENSSFEHLTIIMFLAANIIFSNAQRPGVVQYMTLQEFENRVETGNEQFLIAVMKHKTAALGPANIIICREIETLILGYLKYVRVRMCALQTKYNERLFLTYTGNEFRKISEKIAEVAKHYNLKTPTACIHRKVISTVGYEELSPKDYQLLNDHMSHSSHTARKYYQFPEKITKAATMHDHIVKMTKKQHFTQEEDDVLTSEWPLTVVSTPSLATCREIILRFNLTKSDKQVQDRWRNLKKHFEDEKMDF